MGVGESGEFQAMLDREVETSLLFTHKSLTLTENWVCIQGSYSIRVFPAANLVWAYMYVLNGTFYKVIFMLSDRTSRGLNTMRKKICVETLTGIAQSYPDVWIGFDKTKRQMYNEMFT